MIKLSVVIPCYNEEKNIPLILKRFSEVIDNDSIEVLIVNNGSEDNSQQVLDELLPLFPFARSFLIEKNVGYGHGIVEGLKVAKGEFIGWTHADMQTDPNDVCKALRIIEKDLNNSSNIFLKGTRKGRSFSDNLFTVGMSFFESLLLGCKFWDINAQPTIFHRKFFSKWTESPQDFSLDLFAYFYAKKYNFEIYRFDVEFPNRVHGKSNWNVGFNSKVKFIKRTIEFSLSMRKRVRK